LTDAQLTGVTKYCSGCSAAGTVYRSIFTPLR